MLSPRWLVLLAAGCSFSTEKPTPCTSNLECRQAFGLGSVCADDGLCGVTTAPDRCADSFPEFTFPVDPATTHVIGTVFDHTLETHIGRYRSAQLALSQANVGGGLESATFAVVHCTNEEGTGFDDLTREEASVAVATWLADEVGVPAIVGPAASGDTEAVYNAVGPTFGTLVISPSATSPSLTPLDTVSPSDTDPGLLWRTAPPDDLQGLAIAWDMANNVNAFRTEPSRNVAVVYQIGAYGEGLEATFADALVADGGAVDPFPFDSALGPGDAIASVASGTYDEVLFISSDTADVVGFLLGVDAIAALDTMPIFLTDAARNADVLANAAAAADVFPRIRGSGPANPTGPIFDSFAASYAAEYGGEDVSALSYTAQAFDAAWLVVYGHAWATYQEEAIDGLGLARGLRKVSAGTPVEIRPTGWNEVKGRFKGGESVNVTGASGDLDYDPATGETSAVIELWTIDGGAFVAAETFEP